ncbi:RDD family protein [Alkalihalobacterium bogoriense]|uniref:RDD family protein n=1 Tax=Alkalihalobacterium bogoriense TaxID=246272 RepID=UPI00047B5229|nr:RDD family protein [Alkalihalobacterium bogoriense]
MELKQETQTEKELKDRFLHRDLRAGGIIRTIALFYDAVILGMVLYMVAGGTTLWIMTNTETLFIGNPERARQDILENEPHLFIINYVILGSIFLIYQFIYPMFKKQTFGMMIADLTLVDENRQPLTKRHYLKRECLKLVLFPTYFMSFGKERRTLYDKLTNTYLMKY